MKELIIIYVTVSSREEAEKIAHELVESRYAACANIVNGVTSVYTWKGKVCKDNELLMILKAPADNFEKIRDRVHRLHSYECPEIIAAAITHCDPGYHEWVLESTDSP